MSEQDFAISLSTDTSTFSAVGMLPVGRLDDCHALILADDVAPEEVEALAMSQDAQAGWVGASRLQLSPGVELQGPWPVDADLRRLMHLPDWANQMHPVENGGCGAQRWGPQARSGKTWPRFDTLSRPLGYPETSPEPPGDTSRASGASDHTSKIYHIPSFLHLLKLFFRLYVLNNNVR